MSIATELQNYADGLDDAYDAVNDMSGIIPAHKNMDNLDQAIRTIPQSGGATYTAGYGINIDANNEISVDTTDIAEVSDIPANTSDLVNDGSDGTSTYVEADELATVATSGDYGDLLNTPTIPTNTSDLTNDGDDGVHPFLATDDVATVATSGSYNDLLNTPTIPAAQVNSDWNSNSGVSEILNKPTLATVATSGDYDDLLNKPTIPAAQIQSDWTQADNTKLDYIKNKPSLAAVATSGAYSDLSGTPSLATVATSGDYGDLLNKPTIPAAQVQSNWTQTDTSAVDYIKNKPTIPTVNNATLTIQKNGSTVKTFTANASSNVTANITVPTQFSDLSGTITNAQIADNTIEKGKIKWSTMCSAFTGTTDGNGFIAVPTGTVKPTTGFILGARRVKNNDTGQTDGILMPYTDHSQSRYTLKFVNWNLQANGNQTIKVEIVYCLKSV